MRLHITRKRPTKSLMNKRLSALDILTLPLGCLMQLPAPVFGLFALISLAVGGYIYYTSNSDFGGLARPAFQDLQIASDFSAVKDTADNRSWKITYEYFNDSTFAGVIRDVTHWREDTIPFATHDVLVTAGDYADPQKVETSVSDHHFYYSWPGGYALQGSIHLLHIVPLNEKIYQQLLNLHQWDKVSITGREILRIDMFDPQGGPLGYWSDQGCNTILVKSVSIIK